MFIPGLHLQNSQALTDNRFLQNKKKTDFAPI